MLDDQREMFVPCNTASELPISPEAVLSIVCWALGSYDSTSGSGEAEAAAKIFIDERVKLLTNKNASGREVPLWLDDIVVPPGSTLHFISEMCEDSFQLRCVATFF